MKVHLIKKQSIDQYIRRNAQSKSGFEVWLNILKYVSWEEPNDIIATFNTADILGNGTKRVVFNIGGNNYRIICSYHFGITQVHLFIKWIGTHPAYTKLCKSGNQYEVNQY